MKILKKAKLLLIIIIFAILQACSQDDTVNPANIPDKITAYITANYPGTTIVKSEKSSTEYEVVLSNGIKLEFNLDGSFKEISGDKGN